jgi:hypothetical protein
MSIAAIFASQGGFSLDNNGISETLGAGGVSIRGRTLPGIRHSMLKHSESALNDFRRLAPSLVTAGVVWSG